MDVIILAAGSSKRMGKIKEPNKVFMKILGHPAIMYPIFLFSQTIKNGKIIVVYNREHYDYISKVFSLYKFNVKLVEGGEERQESVYNALKYVETEKVLVHDGARVCIDLETIRSVIEALNNYEAVVPSIKVSDTIKIVQNSFIDKTVDRKNLYRIQTPQGFKTELLIKAIELIKKRNVNITDDASAIELLGKKVFVVKGNEENLKLTNPIDYMIAKAIIYKRLNETKNENYIDKMRR